MPFHPRPHSICPSTSSSPLCMHSCTEQEGQWCLYVVTGKGLEQGHRKMKFILGKDRLDAEVLKPRDPGEVTQ